MKLTIEAKALSRALAHSRNVIPNRNTIPILNNVLLEAGNGKLSLTATDLDMEIVETIEATVETPGEITVPGHLLTDICKKFDAEVTMEVADAQMTVKSGRSRFKLHTLPSSDFPHLTATDFSNHFDISAKSLLSIIGATAFAISTEETRYYLNGIYLHSVVKDNQGFLRSVATDGHRLASSEIDAPDGISAVGASAMKGIIVPRKMVGELIKMLDKPANETVSVDVSDTKIRISVDDIVVTSKVIDGTFPDYNRVIPHGNDKTLVVDKAAFKTAVDRVGTVSSERGRAVKLALTKGKLTLTVNNPDAGSSQEELGVDYAGDDLEIGFNARYLLDLAANMGDGEMELVLADPGSPVLVRSKGEEHTLFVLMPMRVQ